MPLRFFIALALLSANTAGAQLASISSRAEPAGYLSLAAGFLQAASIRDGSTSSDWLFDGAIQYRGSIEYALRNQGAFGVAATYARVPLEYRGGDLLGCIRCDADATIWTAMAMFRMGGGEGFHQVIEIGLGATGYQDFETENGDALPPTEPDMDVTISVGYGFGFGFGKRTSIFLVQSADQSIHQRGGPENDGTTSVQHYVTRIGLRYGLGSRSF